MVRYGSNALYHSHHHHHQLHNFGYSHSPPTTYIPQDLLQSSQSYLVYTALPQQQQHHIGTVSAGSQSNFGGNYTTSITPGGTHVYQQTNYSSLPYSSTRMVGPYSPINYYQQPQQQSQATLFTPGHRIASSIRSSGVSYVMERDDTGQSQPPSTS
jgi:hypothetical protein